jgi:DNA-binding transcriptional regulator LsrR (DeoR family)
MNNQVFDRAGRDCSDGIPGFTKHVINILSLDDIRRMARNYKKQKVVLVATGSKKTEGMRIALETGLANVLITSREDADRLLRG